MVNRIGKILPVEGYYVVLKETLPVDYAKSLTHLYQPLIGIQAVTLYQTLLHEIELQLNKSEPQTHHTLMNYLNLPLDEIYSARLKLEAIGMLKTFKRSEGSNNVFTYELQQLFSPAHFFKDPMLSQLLYHHIGNDKFQFLKQHFTPSPNESFGVNITATFQDVFETVTPSYQQENMDVEEAELDMLDVDFSWMEHALKQRMIPIRKVLTTQNRKLISQMMFLYNLESHDIEKSVLWALTEENCLNTEEFKAACHDVFKQKYRGNNIRLSAKTSQMKNATSKSKQPLTKEEQLIEQLETISPRQLLEDLSSGNHASEQDLRLIRDIMTSQGLPSPVMNVLIHYVLLQSNMKLSKAYVEKIASHWSRANLQTAKEAMAFAKKEKDSYQKVKKTNSSYGVRNKKEVIPDWFKEQKKKQLQATATKEEEIDEAKEQRELEELLRQYSSNNK
ncbi:MAG: replication initiation and membrane attachment family protein [Bacillota bacterium]|uniref:replication initiation and membrane attachment family protein n=1 Tax=Virgibacillus salarius TaxID=447199 RepID=UPI0004017EAE|nr:MULTISPECIES: DnaD domain protein [Bacillaceae]WBX78938.1 DnaD domain protein [Virgibacillus salarius]